MGVKKNIHSGRIILKTKIENPTHTPEELIDLFNEFFITQKNIEYKTQINELPKDNQTIIITSLHFTNIKAISIDDATQQIKNILNTWYLTLIKYYPNLDTRATTFNTI